MRIQIKPPSGGFFVLAAHHVATGFALKRRKWIKRESSI
jgi:hypothetical protein